MYKRQVFNLLGPLTNPAGANIQLTGVYSANLTEPIAQVLADLGSKAALVIHGASGTDELNPCGINKISHLINGQIRTYTMDPLDYGMPRAAISDLRGGTPDEAAQMMRDMLNGKLQDARTDAVLLNAAAAIAAESQDMSAALTESRHSIKSGAALAKLNSLIEFSQSFNQPFIE